MIVAQISARKILVSDIFKVRIKVFQPFLELLIKQISQVKIDKIKWEFLTSSGEKMSNIMYDRIISIHSLIPSLPSTTMNGKILLKNSSKNQKFCFPISAYISNFDQITISVLKRKCFQIYTSAWRLSGGKLFLFIENLSKGIHYIVEK